MAKTTIHLEPQLAETLHELASAQGRSEEELVAEMIRKAAALATTRPARPRPKGIGQFNSGRSDVSERAEELLREAVRDGRWR